MARLFAQAKAARFPLVLDGVRTTGAALMHGSTAVLLDARLGPLDVDPAQRAAILEKAAAVQRQCQVRPALPPRAHDPPTLAGRDAIALRMGPVAAHSALLRAREHRPA